MIKHCVYYFALAILAMFAVDLVIDSWFRFVLYFALGWAIPPYGEIYAWDIEVSWNENKWLGRQIGAYK